MARHDYYKILGVDEKATADDLKKAYRRLAKEHHPDAHPGDKQAEARFKEVSEAYSILGDPQKRQQYDQMRRYGLGTSGSQPGFSSGDVGIDLSDLFGGFSRTNQGRGFKSGPLNLDDFFSFGGLGDIFSQMFDRENGHGNASHYPGRGHDIHATLEVPFETAALGGTTVFVIDKESYCPQCEGSGVRGGGKPASCPECGGAGRISRAQGGFAVNRPCPRCLGRGTIITDPCPSCQGSGKTQGEKKYSLNIPAGTFDGKKLRLKGEGSPGINGLPAGDLIITAKVGSHRFFRLEGKDIYCEIPISAQQAKNGTRIKIKTIHENSVSITVPPDSSTGKTFRLKGMGVKTEEETGDQYVRIKVT